MAWGGGEPEHVTRDGGLSPDISPDGRWLYYVKEAPGQGLWRRPIDGGAEVMGAPSLHRYNFAPVEAGVYFVRSHESGATADVRYLDLAANTTGRRLTLADRRIWACRSRQTARGFSTHSSMIRVRT